MKRTILCLGILLIHFSSLKRLLSGAILAAVLCSCVSLQDRELTATERTQAEVLGEVSVALDNAAKTLTESIPANTTIAILSVYSTDSEIADYVIDELEYRLFNARKFNLVDRRRLEQIRREQNFQMSGDVDDSSAVSIGSMLGANIVITGSVSGSGASQRLILRALDVSTARIIIMTMELLGARG